MTALYCPVLIESAEQAEALPVGTFAVHVWGMGADLRTRTQDGWMSRSGSVLPPSAVVGWTALVPIEAEEEWCARQPHPGGGTRGRTKFGVHEAKARQHCETIPGDSVERRLVTPWEEA